MYCTNCGKQIESGSLCEECKIALSETNKNISQTETAISTSESAVTEITPTPLENSQTQEEVRPAGNRKAGLKPAIAGAIVGFVSMMIISFAMGLLQGFAEIFVSNAITIEDYNVLVTIATVVAVFGAIGCIPAIILGIRAIKTFVREKKATGAKPIATLILGIASIMLSASGIFTAILDLLISSIVM